MKTLIIKKKLLINGCRVHPRNKIKKNLGFSTEIIRLDKNNFMGIEYNHCNRIRIDVVMTKNQAAFNQILDTIMILAKKEKCKCIFFADHISDEDIFSYFEQYGFQVQAVTGDSYNTYFYLQIK